MVEPFKPTIGKTILETLTSGMYDDARFVFREYIQNAADQIDEAVELGILNDTNEGKIEIQINAPTKIITITDNATGVQSRDVLRLLGDVANSQKDMVKQKGFRGIGRLGGLGYCDKLIFETSFQGEAVKNKLTLNAKLLKKIIGNRQDASDAVAAMSVIAALEDPPQDEPIDNHFFRVTLENVHNDALLDAKSVIEYLSMVAPVPFSSEFKFTEEIKTYLKSRNLSLDEYKIVVNGELIYKRYKNTFEAGRDDQPSNLIGVDFVDITNDEQELLAVCWYGYREQSNIVLDELNYERGLRIRTKNIAIGNESTCNKFFDQERTNLRFIGEIHTLGEGFIPNARRDYFTENVTFQQFEKNIREIFKMENLENRLAQTASKLHNRLKEIQKYKETREDFVSKKGTFENAATESFYLNRLKELEEKAKKAKAEIDKIKAKASPAGKVEKLVNSILGDQDLSITDLHGDNLQISKYSPPVFIRLNEEQKTVVLEIFEILEAELDFYSAEVVKSKIIERFNDRKFSEI